MPAMALEGAAPAQVRNALPSVGTYLRAVIALGVGSLRAALPAIAFLYFYRLGMGLYLTFSGDGAGPFGDYEDRAFVTSVMMQTAAYLPLLVLIYTPFLPLQDSLLRGTRRSFMDSVRLVLERFIPFVLSAIAQGVILFGPPVLLFGGMALLVRTFPTRPEDLVRALALATIFPCLLWVAILALFLTFAIPAVVLDGRGPFASIRMSFGLVGRHFGGILGRLAVFIIVMILAAMAASLPEAFLQVGAAAAGLDHPALKIARAIWSAGVSALLFPFSVAALVILYRAVTPGPAIAGPAPGTDPALPEEPRPAASPFRFE